MPELSIKFLGTGTSQGVPVIGCECRVCTSADPRDNRMRSSLHVQTPEASLIVDTGPDFRAQCLRHGVRKVDGVLYTHAHTDHIMGFDDLRPFCPWGEKIPVYGGAETLAQLRRVFEFAFNGENRFPGYMHPEPHEVADWFEIGQTRILPLPVPHGRALVYGFLFERAGVKLAAYLSDCKSVPEPVRRSIAGVRHLILDALRTKPHPTHMNVEEALAVIADVRPQTGWFTHLCHELMHAELEADLPAGVRVAFDGLQLDL